MESIGKDADLRNVKEAECRWIQRSSFNYQVLRQDNEAYTASTNIRRKSKFSFLFLLMFYATAARESWRMYQWFYQHLDLF